MRLRWTYGTAILLMTLAACGQSLASEAGSSRLQALAARQDLRDEVCFAMADGHISQTKRVIILMDAKELLPHEEYLKFRKALDRLSPPKKSVSKQLSKTTQKPAPPTLQQQPQPVEPATWPVIPTGAILPERMAPSAMFR